MSKEKLTPLEIAVYAVNCPNDDKSVNEVYSLIDDHVIERLKRVKERLELSIMTIDHLTKENELLKDQLKAANDVIESVMSTPNMQGGVITPRKGYKHYHDALEKYNSIVHGDKT